jgi:phage tail tape-measure protein
MSVHSLDLRINASGAQSGARVIQRSMSDIGRATDAVKNKLFNLKTFLLTAATGWGIKKLASSFIDVAAQMEQFHLTLSTVIKDAAATEKAFSWVREFARTTPFNTDEVIEAYTLLKSVGMETVGSLEEIIGIVGDTGMVFGRSITDVASALIGMNSMTLRRFGIEVDRESKRWTAKLGANVIETEADINSLRKAVLELMEGAFAGGMEKATNTWTGAMRTIGSLWYEFKADLMGAAGSGGPFDAIKGAVIEVKDEWTKWTESEDYKIFLADAQDRVLGLFVSALDGFSSVMGALSTLYNFVNQLPTTSGMGVLGWYLFGAKGALVGAGLGALLDVVKQIDESLGPNSTPKTISIGGSAFDIAGYDDGFKGVDDSTKKSLGLDPNFFDGTRESIEKLSESIKRQREILKEEKDQWLGADVPGSSGDPAAAAKAVAQASADSKKSAEEEAKARIEAAKMVGAETAAYVDRLQKAKDDALEMQRTVAQGVANFWGDMAWENQAGLLGDEQYFEMLTKDMSGLVQLSDTWKTRYMEIQNIAQNMGMTLAEQFQSGAISSSEFEQSIESIKQKLQELGVAVPDNLGRVGSQFDDLATKADMWTKSLTDGIASAIVQGNSLTDVLQNIGKQILQWGLSKILGGFFGFGFHSGGVVGVDAPTFTRKIPRYHSGGIIGKDEVPAILQKGEMVLTKGQQKVLGESGKGDTYVTMNISAVDAPSFMKLMEQNRAGVESIVTRSIQRSGSVRKAVRGGIA